MRRPSSTLVAISSVGMTCFAICITAAATLYPGGTWYDRRAPGHDFWKNFLCDLMQTRALNGGDAALSSLLARIGMIVIFLTLIIFYLQVSKLEPPTSKAGRVAWRYGLTACLLGCVVTFVPSNRFRDAHVAAVLAAFIPWTVATLAALKICLRAEGLPRWLSALALLTLLMGALDGILYGLAYAQLYGLIPPAYKGPLNASLPVLQRLATLGLLAWMLAMNSHTRVVTRRGA